MFRAGLKIRLHEHADGFFPRRDIPMPRLAAAIRGCLPLGALGIWRRVLPFVLIQEDFGRLVILAALLPTSFSPRTRRATTTTLTYTLAGAGGFSVTVGTILDAIFGTVFAGSPAFGPDRESTPLDSRHKHTS